MRLKFTMRKKKTVLCISVIAIMLSYISFFFSGRVSAFKPTPLLANAGDYSHHSITEEAIKEIFEVERIVPEVGQLTASMKKAMDMIKEGNSATDLSKRWLFGNCCEWPQNIVVTNPTS